MAIHYPELDQEGPTPGQERDHLAEQCGALLRENERLRAALTEIDGWRDDTLGKRPKDPDLYNGPQVETAAFDRGSRMAFYRCSDRARAALGDQQTAATEK